MDHRSNAAAPGEVAPTRPGRVSAFVRSLLMTQAKVIAVERIDTSFCVVALHSPAFCKHAWVPGQKVQIAMGPALATRTYTPIDWDGNAGLTRILGYAHGEGPGSAWLARVQAGDRCDVFGPRASLDLRQASGRAVLLGDETSLGLAHALFMQGQAGPRDQPRTAMQVLLEVRDVAGARAAADHLALPGIELFETAAIGAPIEHPIDARLQALAAEGATFILTGNAAAIQRQRRNLRAQGVPSSRLLAKAYWAQGKTGLD